MRLLIVTQKVNKEDPILGFFHRWIIEFSKHCESIVVICLEKGVYELPANVKILSLGKEEGVSRAQYVSRFYLYIWKERNNYDAVFVHMNPIYVVLGGLVWRLMRKKMALWYTHKSVDWKLKMAEKLTHRIFTASKESFRLKSKKIVVTGHGIDVNHFSVSQRTNSLMTRLITVGRISTIKKNELIIHAVRLLRQRGTDCSLTIVGGPVTRQDQMHEVELKRKVSEEGLDQWITFIGSVSQEKLPEYLKHADIFVNTSETGSLDKAGLEAVVAELSLFSSNESYMDIFGNDAELFLFEKNNLNDLVQKLTAYIKLPETDKNQVISRVRKVVTMQHSLFHLIGKLVQGMSVS